MLITHHNMVGMLFWCAATTSTVFSLMTGLIPVHMLTNISTSKNNQTMKLGQLIEYNIRNIFLNKSCTKWLGETIPRLFSKKSKLSISLDQ